MESDKLIIVKSLLNDINHKLKLIKDICNAQYENVEYEFDIHRCNSNLNCMDGTEKRHVAILELEMQITNITKV